MTSILSGVIVLTKQLAPSSTRKLQLFSFIAIGSKTCLCLSAIKNQYKGTKKKELNQQRVHTAQK